jgi:SulP family sulfate permease
MNINISKYFKEAFVFDLKAGFITAIVALPLAIAFAMASGVSPIMGLYTAVIAGILGSSFGGSRFSITGPTGAMAVIILSTVNKYGLEGLLLAGLLAGIIQILLGVIKLGKLVKFIPLPIVSGFTAGIGVIIFIGQIPNFLGISIKPQEHVWETIIEVVKGIGLINLLSVIIAISTIIILAFFPKLLKKTKYAKLIPASMIALVLATAAVMIFNLQIPQVGEIPSQLPTFQLIKIDWSLIKDVLPAAFTIALLGAIEALLCAVVADGMTNTKHSSNKELIAQGVANATLPFFGGMPATAAIARTAVNVREGAKTRIAGIIHALIILLIILFFGAIAMFIPKAFLAGILMYVSFRMINIEEFKTIIKISKQEALVLFLTFALTVFTDLVFAVQVGMMLAVFLLFIKFSNIMEINDLMEHDPHKELQKLLNGDKNLQDKLGIYTMNGPFFFGAMSIFESKISEHVDVKKKYLIIRMKHVPFIDASAITRLKAFIKERNKNSCKVFLTTLQPKVKESLFNDEEFEELISENNIFETTEEAVEFVKKKYM